MVTRMRDVLGPRPTIGVAAELISVRPYFVSLGGYAGLRLIIPPTSRVAYRRHRHWYVDLDRDQLVTLLGQLTQEGSDDVKRSLEYKGPARGHTTRIGLVDGETPREVEVDVMLSAAPPAGFTANVGDIFLTIAPPAGKAGKPGALQFRLDLGAKRFLYSQLEQNVVIEAMTFTTPAKKSAVANILERARALLKTN